MTLFFTCAEIAGGLISNSLALLSDSAHMVSDVVALALSMTAIYLATRPPDAKYTFGFLRFEVIASFLNGLTLCAIAIGIFYEGIHRFIVPQKVEQELMLVIAVIGLAVNIVLTYILSRSMREENNLNVQSALWHFIGDLLSSIGVIASAILIYWTGLSWFDPLISMVIGAIIFAGGFKIIKESGMILMEKVPDQFDLDEIRAEIGAIDGVEDVHELHLWSVSTDHYSLTAHVFISEKAEPFCVTLAVTETMKAKFGIAHTTVQIEHAAFHPHGEYGQKFLRQKEASAAAANAGASFPKSI